MSNEKIVDLFIKETIESAENEKCCLNCKYSYFSPYNETGLCHNSNMVKGHMHPKVVSEFFECPYWENKKVDKEN